VPSGFSEREALMNALRMMTAALILFVLALATRADDKKADNAKLVIGKWEVTKCDGDGPPVGSTIEMTKDGKIKITAKDGDKEEIHEGTYKVDGDKIMVTLKVDNEEMKHTVMIKKLSDTELVVDHDGKVIEFKKKK
jgi:uncharacterized protein (TIGR03066 family)